MSSEPQLNIRRAAMRPVGRGLDIPGLIPTPSALHVEQNCIPPSMFFLLLASSTHDQERPVRASAPDVGGPVWPPFFDLPPFPSPPPEPPPSGWRENYGQSSSSSPRRLARDSSDVSILIMTIYCSSNQLFIYLADQKGTVQMSLS